MLLLWGYNFCCGLMPFSSSERIAWWKKRLKSQFPTDSMVWFKWWNFKDLCFWFPEDREMIQFDLMVFSLNIGLEPPTSFQAWNDPPCFSKRSSAWPKQSLLSSSLTSKAYGFGTTASKASPNMVPQYAVGHRLLFFLYTNTHSRYIYIWHMYYRFVVVKNHASFCIDLDLEVDVFHHGILWTPARKVHGSSLWMLQRTS